ncbi:MAG: vWA domain-containing protein [Deltaproteobacteria bacterium]|nr:vWA domain-containing protein [Deltaproteobacteria bacterium]
MHRSVSKAPNSNPRPPGRVLALAAACLLTLTMAGEAGAISSVNLDVRSPQDGENLTHHLNLAYLTGDTWVNAPYRRAQDVVMLIDSSGSTADPSGADVDGDGKTGRGFLGLVTNTDGGDSVLAAEIASARKLLQSFDPGITAVAVVTFDGGRTQGFGFGRQLIPDAVVEQPLTGNYHLVEGALARILQRGPDGGTNMAEGVRMAVNELTGFQSASVPRPGAERSIYLFTDGFPTLPFLGWFAAERKNVELTVYYAETAGRLGIKVHAFPVGKSALARPLATVDAARVSGGMFVPVPDPGKLPAVIEAVAALRVQRVTVLNTTTQERARVVKLNPDGTFDSLVPVRPGPNRLEIIAIATDGGSSMQNVTVNYQRPSQKSLDVSVEEARQLEKLLEIQIEEDEGGLPDRDLFLEIEVERRKAFEQAERQREELGMAREPVTSPPTAPGPGGAP